VRTSQPQGSVFTAVSGMRDDCTRPSAARGRRDAIGAGRPAVGTEPSHQPTGVTVRWTAAPAVSVAAPGACGRGGPRGAMMVGIPGLGFGPWDLGLVGIWGLGFGI
jgi:hypothetical protein